MCGGTAEWCVEHAPKSLSQPEKVKQLVYLSKTESFLTSQENRKKKKRKKNAASSEVKRKRQVKKKKKFPRTEMKE